MTPAKNTADPHDDSIDYALGFCRLTEALLPYWQQQECMPPEQAVRKLINEHGLMLGVLREMADGVDVGESYSAWAKRVVEGVR